ncbi:nuclear transport factor 2 family protein [Mycolicibacterium mengxianglii]|uniref:nuclear transport factor 2 family protein n=1 Tax=Mycolicibacterium mengxianglii TaxID=2736649 RepID=UPI0018D1E4FB|nr:nuclear transport factor 2 family protein [Mycolicibacterium mengxianglii]
MNEWFGREQVCLAFCEHRFEDVFPHLAANVRWTVPGYMVLEGADALIRTCRETAESVLATTKVVDRQLVVGGRDAVVVDSFTRYQSPSGVTAVSDCHIFEFVGAQITAITSYAVEVDPDNLGAPASAPQRR